MTPCGRRSGDSVATVNGFVYRRLLRPLLYMIPAEAAHELALRCLRIAARVPGLLALLRKVYAVRDVALRTRVWNLELPSPVGLAAGFDKNAQAFEALGALGFGFVEVGTLTAHGQPGNPKPRLFRLLRDRALINRMGFNNIGSRAAAPRLARPRRTMVGANLGKTKVTPPEHAIADYVESATRLGPHADYVVVNVSSPNTPGLRDLQATEHLRPLLRAVRDALARTNPDRDIPLLVKIAPDLADQDIDAIADLAEELGLHGIIATNTTVRRDGLTTPHAEVRRLGAGGLSGAPVAARALDVLRRLRARVGDRVLLVAAGGIDSPEEAWARIRAGATLVQVYTGLVYQGPGFARQLGEGLARVARAAGYERVQDAVGADAMNRQAAGSNAEGGVANPSAQTVS